MISVVIPTYDNNEMLKDLLDKLNTQTVLPDEVIIIEDGPADTFEIVSKGIYMYPIGRVRHKTNIGVNASWNEGINHSKCDLISILNDDIMISNEFIRKTVDTFNKDNNIGIVTYRNCNLEDVDEELGDIAYVSYTRRIGWAFTVRRTMIDTIMPIPTEGMKTFCGDNYIFSRFKAMGFMIVSLTSCNVWHKGSFTLLKIYGDRKSVHRETRKEKNVYAKGD